MSLFSPHVELGDRSKWIRLVAKSLYLAHKLCLFFEAGPPASGGSVPRMVIMGDTMEPLKGGGLLEAFRLLGALLSKGTREFLREGCFKKSKPSALACPCLSGVPATHLGGLHTARALFGE